MPRDDDVNKDKRDENLIGKASNRCRAAGRAQSVNDCGVKMWKKVGPSSTAIDPPGLVSWHLARMRNYYYPFLEEKRVQH
jgi:hypothetical protein